MLINSVFFYNLLPNVNRPKFSLTDYGRPNAFTRKTAIWARVTGLSGQ